MEPPVVVGGDGSEPSRRATDRAAEEAALRGPPLRVVDAPLWERWMAGEPARVHEQRAVAALEATLADVPPDFAVYPRTAEGHAHRVPAAASHHAGLLVVGLRRRPGQGPPQFGRVADAGRHHAACPVAVVHAPVTRAREDGRP
jgi:nucleotide-binding universal stress UspA family protein